MQGSAKGNFDQLLNQWPHGAGGVVADMHVSQDQGATEEHRKAVREAVRVLGVSGLGEIAGRSLAGVAGSAQGAA